MIDVLRPILGRIIAAIATWLFGWLNNKFGIFVPADEQSALVAKVVEEVVPAVLILYSIIHRLWDAKFNKSDAASPKLAKKLNAQAHPKG